MEKFIAICCFWLASTYCFGQTDKVAISIIPQPVLLVKNQGYFVLPKNIVVDAGSNPRLMPVLAVLKSRLAGTGRYIVEKRSSLSATIRLVLTLKTDTAIGNEGYHLNVNPKSIVITANQPAGLFYGVQTLMQLFPPAIESKTGSTQKWVAPCMSITDFPRFKWRGLMFDVSRHFFTKAEVEQYIDQMVQYKFNLLHLHLTDDEGWRIEIKSLPKLTQVGSYRAKRVGYFGTFAAPPADEPRTDGGFYTQQDIKDLVQYAKERFVNILPEIDVPGHSLAAVVSYPELSCTPGADQYKVRSGEAIMDWGGKNPVALIDNTLCPANEKVYEFLDKVVTEVAQLFPFDYIHMGGDECPKNFWEKSNAVKTLMQQHSLKTMEEVQSYFEKRLEKIVEAKGKKFLGWDEILEGGLSPDAIVMSWRGMKGGITAAKMGHEVVMSPTTFAYLDYMQGDQALEPRIYATLRLNTAYQFEPVPDSVDAKLIIGGQANLWTEQVYNMRHAEYMTWPRGFAIAETLWSLKSKKDWSSFYKRTEEHFKRLDAEQIKYAPSMYDPIIAVSKSGTDLNVNLNTEIPGLDIYYTFDNSFPDRFYPRYTGTLNVPKDAVNLRMITYRGNQPIGRMVTLTTDEMNRRVGIKK